MIKTHAWVITEYEQDKFQDEVDAALVDIESNGGKVTQTHFDIAVIPTNYEQDPSLKWSREYNMIIIWEDKD